jgi:predicted ATPase
LERWTGPAFPELADNEIAWDEVARLAELRVQATESLAAARLRDGPRTGLVTDLTAAVDQDPLRERPRSLLMSALVAEGRTADALRVYDDFRRRLGDELGIEPSPALTAQHAQLLGGDVTATIVAHVPTPMTSLVGRDALVDAVLTDLASSRIVTLLGPGGVGKTRLLIETGQRLDAHGTAVAFCELAHADEASVADAVAATLRIDARIGTTSEQRLVEVIGDSELVVLLDNCEHVVDAAARLAAHLVGSCPGVTVIATSRERLRVPGERLHVVPTLLADGSSDATRLFIERARDARPGFEPTADQAQTITEIVERLDGLPLAIELAAARLHTHELDEVAGGLADPLGLLSSGHRTSDRHSSLRAVVEWSYAALAADLQNLFDAVAVFARPFTVRDAVAVIGLDPCAPERIASVDAMLTELVERSLVTRAPGQRYRMLDTLRAFGTNRLRERDAFDEMVDRHHRWLVSWVGEVEVRLHEPGSRSIDDVDDAIPDLRAAVDRFIRAGDTAAAEQIVSGLLNFALLRLRVDVLAWADSVTPTSEEPRVWAASAYAAWLDGDLEGAVVRAETAVALANERPPQAAAAMRGNVDLFRGRLAEAEAWYRQAVESAENDTQRLVALGAELLALGYANDTRAVELADSLLTEIGDSETPASAYAWYAAGESDLAFDIDRARVRLTRAIEIADATRASFVKGVAGASRASIEVRTGDPLAAAADYLWLIPHWRRASVTATQWTMLRAIVHVLERLGRDRVAAVLEGAVTSTVAGHRIFGADEENLREIGIRLRSRLGDNAYEDALAEGSGLDADRAAELALGELDEAVGGGR